MTMPSPIINRRNGGRKGFTLTEMAIVLGVIAVIIAGVWSAAAVVTDRSHLSNAQNEFNIITQNMTALMQGGFAVTAPPCVAPCDITANMIASETIPQGYVAPGGALGSNPWTVGGLTMRLQSDPLAPVAGSPVVYRLNFYQVSQSGCMGLIMETTACNPGKPGCPIKVGVAGTQAPYAAAAAGNTFSPTAAAPMTTTIAQALCAANSYAGGANSVEFDFTQ